MIEVWAAKAWNRLASPRRRLAAGLVLFLKGLPAKRTGLVLTVATPLLVMGWHLAALAARPAHLDKIVAELGSTLINSFYQDPMPDHSGASLLFIQSTEKGYGLFFCKTGGVQRKLLCEETYKQADWPTETLLNWSPDDRFFAYGRKTSLSWEIDIGDGDSGEPVATMLIASSAVSGAWLSPQTFVFANQNHVLYSMAYSQGKWLPPKPFRYFQNQTHKLFGIRNLTAFDGDSVVWQLGNALWTCSENSDAPAKIWDSTTNTLCEFSYSREAKKFLLHCADANGHFFTDFYVSRRDEPVTRINAGPYIPNHLTLINDGKGYAFMSQIATSNVLAIKLDDTSPVQMQWFDQVKGFAAGQHEMFVTGSRDNQPIGIYRCDLAAGSAECVVPNSAGDLYYWTNCAVERNTLTNSSGETLAYYIYAPPRLPAKKKHPLVIGMLFRGPTGFMGFATDAAFANCGYYYAYVERYQRDQSQWGQDVLTVYESLAKRPEIDTNRVYIYAVSAGAPMIYGLLETRPELWRGAILFSPAGFPKPSLISGKRLFIDVGGADLRFAKAATQFQDDAARVGIPVTLLFHPGLGHTLNKLPPAERERLREAMIFLNDP